MELLERFLEYIAIDTTSNSKKNTNPSTKGQLILAKKLVMELKKLNINKIHFDEKNCYIYAILEGDKKLPKLGFISHLDTSENAIGKNIKPQIIKNYDGKDIMLNNKETLSPEIYPDLKNHIGKTLITTDGTTLLGADDKAGIAEIMSMLEYFVNSTETHGDIYVCFTPDEELGLGTLNFNKEFFTPDIAYTVDGSSVGEFSYENFNAASATIEINGISTHCGNAKNIMINACHIATIINSLLPNKIPANTDGRQGFYHLEEINGNVSKANLKYLIRDFDKESFTKRKELLEQIVSILNRKYNDCIKLDIKDTYYNMYDVIKEEDTLIMGTINAIKSVNIEPLILPIRGGTDGTKISYEGIPCPNLGTGGHNFHSIYEYVTVEDMNNTRDILISIVKEFSKNNKKQILRNKRI